MSARAVFFMTSLGGLLLGAFPYILISLNPSIGSPRAATFWAAAITLAILIGYHIWAASVMSLKPEASSVADSCYYVGFIFTLGILCVSFQLASPGEEGGVAAITSQFALGLLSTIYGLMARIHLSSFNDVETLEDAFAQQEQLAARLVGLSVAIETGTSSTQELFKAQSAHLHTTIQAAKDEMSKEAQSIAELASEFAKRIANLSDSFIPDAEASALKISMGKFAHSVEVGNSKVLALSNSISNLSDEMLKSKTAAAEIQNFGEVFKTVQSQIELVSKEAEFLGKQFSDLRGRGNALTEQMGVSEFSEARQAIASLNKVARDLNVQIVSLETGLGALERESSRLANAKSNISTQIENQAVLPRTGSDN